MNPLQLIQEMLKDTHHRAFLFGGRATGRVHPTSDWDIAITGPGRIDPLLLMDIEEAISQANFIQEVDIVDLATVSPSFKNEVEAYNATLLIGQP